MIKPSQNVSMDASISITVLGRSRLSYEEWTALVCASAKAKVFTAPHRSELLGWNPATVCNNWYLAHNEIVWVSAVSECTVLRTKDAPVVAKGRGSACCEFFQIHSRVSANGQTPP